MSIKIKQTVNEVTPRFIIDGSLSYNENGITSMDKDRPVQYEDKENIVAIERVFMGIKPLDSLLKEYIMQHRNKKELYFSQDSGYNVNRNTVVVDSFKEECE